MELQNIVQDNTTFKQEIRSELQCALSPTSLSSSPSASILNSVGNPTATLTSSTNQPSTAPLASALSSSQDFQNQMLMLLNKLNQIGQSLGAT